MKKVLPIAILILSFGFVIAQTGITVAGGNGQGATSTQVSRDFGLFVDSAGGIYVADDGNSRIQYFAPGSNQFTPGVTVAGGQGNGIALTQLDNPCCVFVDRIGNIYGSSAGVVKKFNTNSDTSVIVAGNLSSGTGDSSILGVSGIYIDTSGYIYVTDMGNARVLRFPPNSVAGTIGTIVAGGNGNGNASNQLNAPFGIFVDESGNIYVGDANNHRVQKFPANSNRNTNAKTVAGGNGAGSLANQLEDAGGVFLDNLGYLYECDALNNRIQRFPPNSDSTSQGVTVAGGNGRGDAANQLSSPSGVMVSATGDIYIADTGNSRVQKWMQGKTGISNVGLTEDFITVYPNPGRGQINLQTNKSIGKTYSVYNALGQLILQQIINNNNQIIDVNNQPTGVYWLTLQDGKELPIKFYIEAQ